MPSKIVAESITYVGAAKWMCLKKDEVSSLVLHKPATPSSLSRFLAGNLIARHGTDHVSCLPSQLRECSVSKHYLLNREVLFIGMNASNPPLYIAVIVHKYSISGLDVRSIVLRVPANQNLHA